MAATKSKTAAKITKSRGSVLLERAVEKYGSYEKATEDLNKTIGAKYLRASVWHWATGQHKPSRSAASALDRWAKIPLPAWDEPARA